MPASTDITVRLDWFTWTLLRMLVRNNHNAGLLGKTLRHSPARSNKDGEFLNELVRIGLIKRVAKSDTWQTCMFKITDLGIHAAEYGEYRATREGVAVKNQPIPTAF